MHRASRLRSNLYSIDGDGSGIAATPRLLTVRFNRLAVSIWGVIRFFVGVLEASLCGCGSGRQGDGIATGLGSRTIRYSISAFLAISITACTAICLSRAIC